jgi:threonine/homoserine/homoserine lactone efflux protein
MVVDLILIGAAIALEPIPLTGYILLRSTEGGNWKGYGFILGWILTLALIVVLTMALTGGKPLKKESTPSTAMLIVKIILGCGLLVVAWRQSARRGRSTRATPSWMVKLDRVNFAGAMGTSFLLQPWLLVAAGAVTATAADLSQPTTVAVLVGYCVLATSTYLVMQAYGVISPDGARSRLDGFRQFLTNHRDQVIILLCVVIGLWLIGESAYTLAS